MNTDAECRATLNAAAAALRDAGVQARLELRSIGLCDDGVQCAARLVDLGSLEIVEIVAGQNGRFTKWGRFRSKSGEHIGLAAKQLRVGGRVERRRVAP